jgi:hypothetical protein
MRKSTNEEIYKHMVKEHSHLLGEMSAPQAHYYYRNKGKKPICHLPGCSEECPWDYVKEKPKHYCSEECRKMAGTLAAKNGAKQNMNDPDIQFKLQDSRGISGVKKFRDGAKVPYMGKSELALLDLLERKFHLDGEDIGRPTTVYKYKHEGKEKMYLPDYELFGYNIVIECKEDLANKNSHPDRIAQRDMNKLKEEAVLDVKNMHYLRFHPDDIMNFSRYLKDAIARKGKVNGRPVVYTPKGYF